MSRKYGITLAVGNAIVEGPFEPELSDRSRTWIAYYQRALAGETVVVEDGEHGELFRYSLSPITDVDHIVGVMVLAQKIADPLPPDNSEMNGTSKSAELRLMTLHSILNSHFIFNVLSSIQFFIARSDKVNSIRFLSIFSQFIRSILTHAISTSISVSDETTMLKNYVDMEMTRFENTFDFVLEIDSKIDLDASRIPPLLIQPFVENAILHGLYNLDRKGRLSVRVQENHNAVIFTIEDNGIGRKRGVTLKQRNALDREPLGVKLATERLRLVRGVTPAQLEITDLEENGVPCGTRVVITIPHQFPS